MAFASAFRHRAPFCFFPSNQALVPNIRGSELQLRHLNLRKGSGALAPEESLSAASYSSGTLKNAPLRLLQPSALYFHTLTNCFFANSPIFILLQTARGWGSSLDLLFRTNPYLPRNQYAPKPSRPTAFLPVALTLIAAEHILVARSCRRTVSPAELTVCTVPFVCIGAATRIRRPLCRKS